MIRKCFCLAIFSFIFQFSYSQACGGGEFRLEFYTKNNDNLKYEIMEVEIKNDKLLLEDFYNGIIVDKNVMNGISLHEFNKKKLPIFISESIVDGDRIFNNGLIFKTL